MLSVYKTFTLRYNKVVFIYKSPVRWGVQIAGMIFRHALEEKVLEPQHFRDSPEGVKAAHENEKGVGMAGQSCLRALVQPPEDLLLVLNIQGIAAVFLDGVQERLVVVGEGEPVDGLLVTPLTLIPGSHTGLAAVLFFSRKLIKHFPGAAF